MKDNMTPPQPDDKRIITISEAAFGIRSATLSRLDGGADFGAAKYRVQTKTGRAYFLKARQDAPTPAELAVPTFLNEQGIAEVVAPVRTRIGKLGAEYEGYVWVLYPFLEGTNAWNVTLTPEQWRRFGALVRRMHDTPVPPDVAALLPNLGTFSSARREMVLRFLDEAAPTSYQNPTSARLATLLTDKASEIRQIVERAEQLARTMPTRPLAPVLTHGDLHAGNLLVDAGGGLSLIDWDGTALAPRERDLMFVGAGIGGIWNDPREAAHFSDGYGDALIDPAAIAYYRHERIVEDFAAFGEQVFSEQGSEAERKQAVGFVAGQFAPGEVFDIARQTFDALGT